MLREHLAEQWREAPRPTAECQRTLPFRLQDHTVRGAPVLSTHTAPLLRLPLLRPLPHATGVAARVNAQALKCHQHSLHLHSYLPPSLQWSVHLTTCGRGDPISNARARWRECTSVLPPAMSSLRHYYCIHRCGSKRTSLATTAHPRFNEFPSPPVT